MSKKQDGEQTKPKKRTFWKILMWAFGGLFLLGFCQSIVTQDNTDSGAKTPVAAKKTEPVPAEDVTDVRAGQINKINKRSITKVEVFKLADGDGLRANIWMNASDNFTVSMSVKGTAMAVYDAAKEVTEQYPDINDMLFFIETPVVDKYGNESNGLVFKLKLAPRSELQKINWKGYDYRSFLNNMVTADTVTPVGRQMLVEYCKGENLQSSRNLCISALQ